MKTCFFFFLQCWRVFEKFNVPISWFFLVLNFKLVTEQVNGDPVNCRVLIILIICKFLPPLDLKLDPNINL